MADQLPHKTLLKQDTRISDSPTGKKKSLFFHPLPLAGSFPLSLVLSHLLSHTPLKFRFSMEAAGSQRLSKVNVQRE